MLKPNNRWKWYFDSDLEALMLELGQDMVFRVAIEKKNLIPDAYAESHFSIDDAANFTTFSDAVAEIDLSDPRKTELILNAAAAKRFHKPFLPKSWFFHPQHSFVAPSEGTLIELMTESGIGKFIVIENSGTASLCMLAQESSFSLGKGKTMRFCNTIKVMNDRIFVIEKKSENHILALVG